MSDDTGELVYTGLTRTPLMALTSRAPFAGRWTAVMNELFATTADVHRVLGALPEAADQHPAADGGEKSWDGSARRLARMIGADLADGRPADWQALAAWFARYGYRPIRTPLLEHTGLFRRAIGEQNVYFCREIDLPARFRDPPGVEETGAKSAAAELAAWAGNWLHKLVIDPLDLDLTSRVLWT